MTAFTQLPPLPAALLIGLLGLADLAGCGADGEAPALSAAELTAQSLFVGGEGGLHTYRIPSLLVTRAGVVLAFAEGRHAGSAPARPVARAWRGCRMAAWLPARGR